MKGKFLSCALRFALLAILFAACKPVENTKATPAANRLAKPANLAVATGVNLGEITVRWNKDPEATAGYELWIGSDATTKLADTSTITIKPDTGTTLTAIDAGSVHLPQDIPATIAATGNAYQIIVGGLTAGTTYHVKLKAKAASSKIASNDTSASAAARTVPLAKPTLSSVAAKSDTELTVTWGAITDATAGYTVTYATDSNFASPLTKDVTEAVTVDIDSLIAATQYSIKVKAKANSSGAGASPDSDAVAAYTKLAKPAVTVLAQSTTELTVTITRDDKATAGYIVSWGAGTLTTGGTTSSQNIPLPANGDTAYNITGLTAATQYHVKVKANAVPNGAGESADSDAVAAYTKLAAPTLSSVAAKSDTELTVKWGAITDATAGYTVTYATDLSFTNPLTKNAATGTLTADIDSLRAATQYHVKVKANAVPNGAGESADSTTDDAYTNYGAPANVTLTAGRGKITVKWDTLGTNSEEYELWLGRWENTRKKAIPLISGGVPDLGRITLTRVSPNTAFTAVLGGGVTAIPHLISVTTSTGKHGIVIGLNGGSVLYVKIKKTATTNGVGASEYSALMTKTACSSNLNTPPCKP